MNGAALITARDALAGEWSPTSLQAPPPPKPLDEPAALLQWEPWVRAAVLDVELTQGLRFDIGPPGAPDPGAVLLGWSNAAGGTTPVVCLRRPPLTPRDLSRQVELVAGYADLREDRLAEILAQAPTLIPAWTAIAGLQPGWHRWTFELLTLAGRFAIAVEMRMKHALAVPRPVAYSAQIQPVIQTPGHGSFPSGHSTEAHVAAEILIALRVAAAGPHAALTTLAQQLRRMAARLAINRTVAGVHFPIDSRAGQILGTTLAEYLLCRCGVAPAYVARDFDPARAMDDDFAGAPHDPVDGGGGGLSVGPTVGVSPSAMLAWLWGKALAEWQ